MVCHCGSGLFRADCVNPENEHRMQVVTETHYGQAVLDEIRNDETFDPGPGALISVQLLPAGETAKHPNELAREQAAAEVAEMKRRHGLS